MAGEEGGVSSVVPPLSDTSMSTNHFVIREKIFSHSENLFLFLMIKIFLVHNFLFIIEININRMLILY